MHPRKSSRKAAGKRTRKQTVKAQAAVAGRPPSPSRRDFETASGHKRAREIFDRIVDLYLETGAPVGSAAVAENLADALSPASIRAIMAQLENDGLLFQPHISAGRLPTESGLRLFARGLLQIGGEIPAATRARIDMLCRASGTGFDDALLECGHALSGLAASASMVICPTRDEEIRHVEFVSLGRLPQGGMRALVVIVTASGQVENRIIILAPGITHAHLAEAGNLMSTLLAGVTLGEAARRLGADIEHRRSEISELAARVVESGAGILGGAGSNHPPGGRPAIIISGAAHLLEDISAVEDIERIRNLFAMLEARENTLSVLDAVREGSGVQIFIGAENALFRHTGCAMIIAPYRDAGEKIIGAVGVIGPARMNYSAIIPLVNYTGEAISKMLK